jgi:hypothetical protein
MVKKARAGISVRAGSTVFAADDPASVHRFVRKYATSGGSNLEYDFARRVRTSTVLEGFTRG